MSLNETNQAAYYSFTKTTCENPLSKNPQLSFTITRRKGVGNLGRKLRKVAEKFQFQNRSRDKKKYKTNKI